MLITETKARRLIITDRRDYGVFQQHLNDKSPAIIKSVKALWAKQKEEIDLKMAEKIVHTGGIPQELSEGWRDLTFLFVMKDLAPEWTKSIETAGHRMARKVNRIQTKQFDFNTTMAKIKEWIDSQGGRLIVDLTSAQYSTMYALIQNQITWGVTSPYLMAQRIKPIIGLTKREANAVSKLMATMLEEGIPAGTMNYQVERYAKFLHDGRAMRIARTEISNAYNFGEINSVRQARDEGWLPGAPQKEWMAGGDNPCEDCLENEGAGSIAVDNTFPSGDDAPTAHPNCKCTLGYSVRR